MNIYDLVGKWHDIAEINNHCDAPGVHLAVRVEYPNGQWDIYYGWQDGYSNYIPKHGKKDVVTGIYLPSMRRTRFKITHFTVLPNINEI